MPTTAKKPTISKRSRSTIYSGDEDSMWVVVYGELIRTRGRPQGGKKVDPLFKCVGQKIPFDFLGKVKDCLEREDISSNGVYAAHDSMGVVRYVGRGDIFHRLRQRKDKNPLELEYFSFWVVLDKHHEREIETLLIRGAGPLLVFNERKKRVGIESGNVMDYEPGTLYFERQRKKGPQSA